MINQARASSRGVLHKKSAAVLSLAASSATVVLASITHAYSFGYRAFIAGSIVIALLCSMNLLYRRTGKRAFLLFYGFLSGWVVVAFGVINGFWNHAFKLFLYYLHNGSLPSFLARLSPDAADRKLRF